MKYVLNIFIERFSIKTFFQLEAFKIVENSIIKI